MHPNHQILNKIQDNRSGKQSKVKEVHKYVDIKTSVNQSYQSAKKATTSKQAVIDENKEKFEILRS